MAPLRLSAVTRMVEMLVKLSKENAAEAKPRSFNLLDPRTYSLASGCLCCQPGPAGAAARRVAASRLAEAAECASQAPAPDLDAMGPGMAAAVARALLETGAAPRFPVGAAVECNLGEGEWARGKVVKQYWRGGNQPWESPAHPYQIRLLDGGELIYAPADDDELIRAAQ